MSQLRIRPIPLAEAVSEQALAPRARPVGRGGPPVAVFDLDGTLVDTAPDLVASLNHCLRSAGLGEVSAERVRPHVGQGSRAMLLAAYGWAARTLDEDELAAQVACFLRFYEAHIADLSRPYPGVLDAMERLEAAGFRLAVCTNKYESLSRRLIDALSLGTRFAAVCGADTFQRRKPDPVHLLGTIEEAGGQAPAAVMIGDAQTDVDAAWAAGIPSVLVDFGYDANETARRRASAVISSYAELDAALLRRLIGENVGRASAAEA